MIQRVAVLLVLVPFYGVYCSHSMTAHQVICMIQRVAVLLVLFSVVSFAQGRDQPSRLDLDTAEHYLKDFEQRAQGYRGKPFDPMRVGQRAMKQVRALRERYPQNPKIQELYDRVAVCIRLSKGRVIEITPEMLAYRQRKSKLKRRLGEAADKEFARLSAGLENNPALFLATPFPIPDPEDFQVAPKTLHRKVILSGVRYPDNLFHESGIPTLYVGEPTTGFYFLRLDTRAWSSSIEALRRFQLEVDENLPREWIVVGTIVDRSLAVPRSGTRQSYSNAYLGWSVKPQAIYIPGVVLAYSSGRKGSLAGEGNLLAARRGHRKNLEISKTIAPRELISTFATSIKEKNYDLFLACIAPAERETPPQQEMLRYRWKLLQQGFARDYVHIESEKVVEIRIVVDSRPGKKAQSMADFFTPDKEKKKGPEPKTPGQLIEEVVVTIHKFNESGQQVGEPVPVRLRRYSGSRWYLYRGFPW